MDIDILENIVQETEDKSKQDFQKLGRLDGISPREVEIYYAKFLNYISEYGFTHRLDVALEAQQNGFKQRFLYEYQAAIAFEIIKAVLTKNHTAINISIPRQIGKTTVMSMVVSFLFKNYYEIFKEPFRCGLLAPSINATDGIFESLKTSVLEETDYSMKKRKSNLIIDEKKNTIEVFSIGARASTAEGRTFTLLIREEAHDGDDSRFIDEFLPTLTSTNGSYVLIGNGGFRQCLFYDNILRGSCDVDGGQNVVLRFPYRGTTTSFSMREYLLSTGLRHAVSIVKSIDFQISSGHKNNLMQRKNFELDWFLENADYVSASVLRACVAQDETPLDKKQKVYIGIDVASSVDQTVAAIMTKDFMVLDVVVIKDARTHEEIKRQIEKFFYLLAEWNVGLVVVDVQGVQGDSTWIQYLQSNNVPCYGMNYKTAKRKAQTYEEMREKIYSGVMKFHPSLTLNGRMDIIEEEFTGIEVRNTLYGKSYHARGRGHDDVVSSIAFAMLAVKQSLSPIFDDLVLPSSGLGLQDEDLLESSHSFRDVSFLAHW